MSINLQLIHRAVLEKLRFKKKVIQILTSNISEICGPIILPKELDQELFESRNRWMYETHFIHFQVLHFVNKKRTVIARKLIICRKYRYFNSLLNATNPIQIHKAVLEKLRFEKKG